MVTNFLTGLLEGVFNHHSIVVLARVEVLGVQRPAAQGGGAAEDHGVPEGEAGALVQVYGRQHAAFVGGVGLPARKIVDYLAGGREGERVWDFAGDVHEELL